MAATSAEFLELIGQEIHVNIKRLQTLAFYGIPQNVRRQVWKLLIPNFTLAVTQSNAKGKPIEELEIDSLYYDVGNAYSSTKELEVQFFSKEFEERTDSDILKMVRSEMNRCHYIQNGVDYFKSSKVRESAEHVILQYYQNNPNNNFENDAAVVHLLCPFVFVFKKDEDSLFCFEHLMRALKSEFSPRQRKKTLSKFLMLFRSRLPELYTHFEEEDIEHNRWAVSWLRWLLCRELSLECCLRLWDSYFANPGQGFDLHVYVCLAILENCKMDLLELEYPELMAFLRHIPNLDMDRILHHAQCLALDFQHQ